MAGDYFATMTGVAREAEPEAVPVKRYVMRRRKTEGRERETVRHQNKLVTHIVSWGKIPHLEIPRGQALGSALQGGNPRDPSSFPKEDIYLVRYGLRWGNVDQHERAGRGGQSLSTTTLRVFSNCLRGGISLLNQGINWEGRGAGGGELGRG